MGWRASLLFWRDANNTAVGVLAGLYRDVTERKIGRIVKAKRSPVPSTGRPHEGSGVDHGYGLKSDLHKPVCGKNYWGIHWMTIKKIPLNKLLTSASFQGGDGCFFDRDAESAGSPPAAKSLTVFWNSEFICKDGPGLYGWRMHL